MSSALDPVRSVTGERDSAKAKREGKKKPPSKPSQSEEQKKKKKRRALRGSDDERALAKTQFHFRVRRQGQFSIVRAKIEKQNRSQREKKRSRKKKVKTEARCVTWRHLGIVAENVGQCGSRQPQ